jgi:TPR repeat protein
MTRLWKIALPLAAVAVICATAVLWSVHKKKVAERKLAETASQYRARAEKGDAEARFKLGKSYYYGKGVPQDYAEALRWFRKAADQGDKKSQTDVGYMYSSGKGVPQDDAEALLWFRKAADQGFATAQYSVCDAYYRGKGVPQDYAEALPWCRKATDQGYARAQDTLAAMYYQGNGVPQDYAEAARWYRKAAEQGDAWGQDDLATMYYNGKGVPQDYAEAGRWYRKAAEHGVTSAEYDLGYMYFYGKGTPRDYAQAYQWFHKAADQGDARAQNVVKTHPGRFTKIYLALAFLGGMALLGDSLLPRQTTRDRQRRTTALAGLLLLMWVGLKLYGFSRFGSYEPGAFANGFYLVQDLLLVICVAALVLVLWPQNSERRALTMRALRQSLAWIFAVACLVCLWICITDILTMLPRYGAVPSSRSLYTPIWLSVSAVIFGMAWLTASREKPSGRWWSIAASLMIILPALVPVFYAKYAVRGHFFVVLAIGVAGLIAFSPRYDANPAAATHKNLGPPGDGTSEILNSIATFVNLALALATFFWWERWAYYKNLSPSSNELFRIALYIVVILIIVFVHELAHTATGLALGMKLRAFLAGPFQWRMFEGKWEFRFQPLAILGLQGATGVVPRSADFAQWRELTMVAAGPLVTLLTGGLALWIALTAGTNSFLQLDGLIALFGALSMAVGVGNLLPFRTGDSYSDGAQIYQLVSGGPWADFHRVVKMVTSSLVTPLRARDLDIEAIQRTARTFTHGKHALLLRLFAYMYFFDSGRLQEATQALAEAESIYHESASDIPAELYTTFVFGNAYLRRDAVAAREWWTRMEAKKPTRFNVDYWKAYSALRWVEGDLKEANEAWEKSNTLAQQLPKAGAYEFDRYCCSKLRQALDEARGAGWSRMTNAPRP